jgi:hypothetical protein
MKSRWAIFHALVKDESAQGATEYILILVVVVGIALIFKDRITAVVKGKLEELGISIERFKPES